MVTSELHFQSNARGYERVKSYFDSFFELDEIEANNEIYADGIQKVGGAEEAVESIFGKDETDDEEVAKVQLDKIQERGC